MKVLALSIKREWFDKILSGEKKTETREVRPNTAYRYIEYVDSETGRHYPKEDGVPDEIIDRCDAVPLKYDALKLLTGAYNVKPRPYIIVKVKDAKLYVLTDEAGNEIVYEYNGKEYVASEIDYELGEIIEDKSRI